MTDPKQQAYVPTPPWTKLDAAMADEVIAQLWKSAQPFNASEADRAVAWLKALPERIAALSARPAVPEGERDRKDAGRYRLLRARPELMETLSFTCEVSMDAAIDSALRRTRHD